MVPISLAIRLLESTGLLPAVGRALEPLMAPLGLPGEMGIIWATAMIANLYAAMLALAGLTLADPLTTAQLTTLATLMLVAHNLPLEVPVCGKAGVRMAPIFLLRVGGGYLFAFLLARLWTATGALSGPATIPLLAQAPDSGFAIWAWGEVRKYTAIAGIVLLLIVLLDGLEAIGAIALLNRLLAPLVRLIGIGPAVMPITLIGMTLGLAYGGGLIVAETRERRIAPKEVFLSLALLSLFHSLLEDTLLMISIGAHPIGIVAIRGLLTLALMRVVKAAVDRLPDRFWAQPAARRLR